MSRVLVVDDESNLRKVLAAILRKEGYEVAIAENGEVAQAEFEKNGADVVITDMVMPKVGGLELLKSVHAIRPDVPVIIITAHGTVDSAVEAIKAGAFDYITKPFEQSEIQSVVAKAARTQEANQAHVPPEGRPRTAIVGDSPATVLITGESGTGKELVATALHDGSSRKDKPLIKISCAAIPKDLMESELFGYERGAFTGAVTSKPGRFELADGGTLFLDEIGEVPIEMQVKLLRVLQESEFERVGGIKTTRVDVRLIAATNRDLEAEVDAGRFRKDLFYRLNVVPLHLPPLRERRTDVPSLARHFIEKYNKRLNKKIEGIADDALVMLQAYPWPGNIRELENMMERVLLFADGPRIEVKDLPEPVRTSLQSAVAQMTDTATPMVGETPLKDFLKAKQAEIEKAFIVQALAKTEGNVTRAAKLLGISRKSLQTKMKEFGLRDESPPEE